MSESRDLGPAFFALTADERTALLAIADDLEVEIESCPPLRAIVEAAALAREAGTIDGGREAAFREAGRRLGLDGDALARKLRYWKARSAGKKFRDAEPAAREVVGER